MLAHDRHRAPAGPAASRSRGPGRRPAAAGLVAVAVLAVAATACGTSGRTLRDPVPGATAPPRKGATTSVAPAVLGTTPGAGLSIISSSWTPGGTIPRASTCDGQDISPPLTISGAPAGTVELVLVVTDQDAAGFVHWVVGGIAPGAPSFPQGGLPAGAVEAPNSSGTTAWFGPCPPAGTSHTYDFTVYALTQASGLGPTSSTADLDAALALTTSTAAVTGTYTRA
jgi:Raf kinase inhibitor-like YbhB/YbcL family protein